MADWKNVGSKRHRFGPIISLNITSWTLKWRLPIRPKASGSQLNKYGPKYHEWSQGSKYYCQTGLLYIITLPISISTLYKSPSSSPSQYILVLLLIFKPISNSIQFKIPILVLEPLQVFPCTLIQIAIIIHIQTPSFWSSSLLPSSAQLQFSPAEAELSISSSNLQPPTHQAIHPEKYPDSLFNQIIAIV